MRQYFYSITFAALLAVAVLSGCGDRPGNYGNFAEVDSVELVRDALAAMQANYPPAKTRIALIQDTSDAFGSPLVESMREAGYAVAEYAGPAKGDKYIAIVEKPDGLAFAYVLDRIGPDELRVSLHIGTETLSRMYRVRMSGDAPQFIPQGFWTHKQGG
ncbi:MAG: hypothetical protein LUE17_17475 [Planctomycetaceae bacterium]|nr:hypothetical protein [Planctomycetaceae bacterium]